MRRMALNRQEESDGLSTLVFFVVVLALVVVITIDDFLQAPPLQGSIPVSTTPP